jgi:hypothetical protein
MCRPATLRAALLVVTAATFLAGCGARAGLPNDRCVWSADGPIVALTDPTTTGGAVELQGLAAEGDRVFAAYYQIGPSPSAPGMFRLGTLVVSDDLTSIGPPRVVYEQPYKWDSVIGGLAVAAGFGHRGAVLWQDGVGCHFVALAEDGAASSGPALVTPLECFDLHATASGFTVLAGTDEEGKMLLSLDPAGNVVGATALTSQLTLGVAHFDDGSLLLATSADDVSITVQHFSEAGAALAAPRSVPSPGSGLSTSEAWSVGLPFAMSAVGSSALIATATMNPGGSSVNGMRVLSLDEDGNVAGASTLPALSTLPADSALPAHLDIAVGDRGALLASTDLYGVTVQSVYPTGEADGAAFTLPLPQGLLMGSGFVRIVGTAAGALVVLTEQESMSSALYAARLRCER